MAYKIPDWKPNRLASTEYISKMQKKNEQLLKTYEASNLRKFNDSDKYDDIITSKRSKGQKNMPDPNDYSDPYYPYNNENVHSNRDYVLDSYSHEARNESIATQEPPHNMLSPEFLDPSLPIKHQKVRKAIRRAKLPIAGKPSDKNTEGFKQIYSENNSGPELSVHKAEFPSYALLERTRPTPRQSEPLNVLTAEYLDPTLKIKHEEEIKKDALRSERNAKLPVAGKKSISSNDGVKKTLIDARDFKPLGKSVAHEDYAGRNNVERVKPIKRNEASRVLPYDGDFEKKTENQRYETDYQKNQNMPVAGKKSGQGEQLRFDQIYDTDIQPFSSVHRDEYPQWEAVPQIRRVPKISEALNVFNDGHSDVQTNNETHIDNTQLPAAGVATKSQEKFQIGDSNNEIVKLSESRENYLFRPFQEKTRPFTPSKDTPVFLNDGSVNSKWETEQHSSFIGHREFSPTRISKSSIPESINLKYDGNNNEIQKSEYNERYVTWENDQIAKSPKPVIKSNFSLSQGDKSEWVSEYDTSFTEKHLIEQARPIKNKTSNAFILKDEFSDNSPKTSEYKNNFISYDHFERVKPYNPVNTSDLTFNHGKQDAWESENKSSYRTVDSDYSLPIAGKATGQTNITTSPIIRNEENPKTSEYKEEFVAYDSFERVTPYNPASNDYSFLKQNLSAPWNSEYDSNYTAKNVSSSLSPIAGKPSKVSTGVTAVLSQNLEDKLNDSEYKNKFVSFGPIERVYMYHPTDSLVLSYSCKSDSESEHTSKIHPKSTHDSIEPAGKATTASEHVSSILSSVSNKTPQTEYDEKYTYCVSNTQKLSPVKHEGSTIFPCSTEKPSWETEYSENYIPIENRENDTINQKYIADKVSEDHVGTTIKSILPKSENLMSEYSNKFVPWDVVKTSDEIARIRTRPVDSINLTNPSNVNLLRTTEQQDSFKPHEDIRDQNKIAGKRSMGSQKFADVIYQSSVQQSTPNSEYKDMYIKMDVTRPLDVPVNTRRDSIEIISLDATPSISWKSEQQSKFTNSEEYDSIGNSTVAGKKSLNHGKIPLQFAWVDTSEKNVPNQTIDQPNLPPKTIIKKNDTPFLKMSLDDSVLPTKWQSEYDAKCLELRQKMLDIKSQMAPIAGKPTEDDGNRPINFAWASKVQSTCESASNLGHASSNTEYRDNFVSREKYYGTEKIIKAPRVSSGVELCLASSIEPHQTWTTEYDENFQDYSSYNTGGFPLAKTEPHESNLSCHNQSSSETSASEAVNSVSKSDVVISPKVTTDVGKLLKRSTRSTFTTESSESYSAPSKLGAVSPKSYPNKTTSTESPGFLLNTTPTTGEISKKLLEEKKTSQKLKNPLIVTEAQRQYKLSGPTSSKLHGRNYTKKIVDIDSKKGTTKSLISIDSLNKSSLSTALPDTNEQTQSVSEQSTTVQPSTSPSRRRVPEAAGMISGGWRRDHEFDRPKTAPTRRSLFGQDGANILFYNPRYPLGDVGRWTTETRSSYSWK